MNLSGTWINQQGSTMEISESAGKISGLYFTKKGSPLPTEQFVLTGYVNGPLLCFIVNFSGEIENHHSLGAWVGRYVKDDEGEKIHTVWHLARTYTNKDTKQETDIWNTFLTNASIFEKIE